MKSDFYPFNITVASTDDKSCRSSFLAACEKDSVSGFLLGKHIVFRSLISGIPADIKHHIFGYSASVYGVEVISRMPSYGKSYCFRFSRIFSVDKFSFQEDTLTLCVPPVAGTDMESVSMEKAYSHVITPAS